MKNGPKDILKEGAVFNRGAENVNTSLNLSRKLSQLEKAQTQSVRIRILQDKRIRYYGPERSAFSKGPTRGSAYVTEYDPFTNNVRTWNECYDHLGKVNRVHPKMINGQVINSIHYPPIAGEIMP